MDQRHGRSVRGAVTAVLAVVLALTLAACATSTPSQQFADRPTSGLATKLERPPKYSGPGASTWAGDYTPSTTQFVNQFYPAKQRTGIRTQLEQQGLREVVHALWITDDEIQNDVVVLRFDDSAGAIERVQDVRTTNEGNPALKSYTIAAPGNPIVFYSDRAVSNGYLQANAYAQLGNFVIEMFTFATNSIPRGQIERWLRAQLTLLD